MGKKMVFNREVLWTARLKGLSDKYGFRRVFIDKIDENAQEGIYEYQEIKGSRKYILVENSTYREITASEAKAILEKLENEYDFISHGVEITPFDKAEISERFKEKINEIIKILHIKKVDTIKPHDTAMGQYVNVILDCSSDALIFNLDSLRACEKYGLEKVITIALSDSQIKIRLVISAKVKIS